MLYATNNYTVTGGVDIFPIVFSGESPGYLKEDHVEYWVGGVLQDPADLTFLTPTSVQISPLPVDGTVITLRRESSIEVSLVDWESRQAVTEVNLDLNTTQMLYLAQETLDLVGNGAADAAASALAAKLSEIAAAASEAAALLYSQNSEASAVTSEASAVVSVAAASVLTGDRFRTTANGSTAFYDVGFSIDTDFSRMDAFIDGVLQYDAFPCDASGVLIETGQANHVNLGSTPEDGTDVLIRA